MNYTITELLWLLLVYSFLGWLIETVVGTIKNRSFINRGFSTGPFCLVYGIAAVLMTLTTGDLLDNTFFLFIGCGILATMVEWFTGKLLERLNSHKWWDYSGKKWMVGLFRKEMELRWVYLSPVQRSVGGTWAAQHAVRKSVSPFGIPADPGFFRTAAGLDMGDRFLSGYSPLFGCSLSY